MFERFTEKAKESIQQAYEPLREEPHRQLDVEHILMALLHQTDSTVAHMLQKMNVDVPALTADLAHSLSQFSSADTSSDREDTVAYVTMRVKRLLEAAVEDADRLNNHYIGTEHLLVAALAANNKASALLVEYGIDKDKVYSLVWELRNAGATEPLPAPPSGIYPWSISDDRAKSTNVGPMSDLAKQLKIITIQVARLNQHVQALDEKLDELLSRGQ